MSEAAMNPSKPKLSETCRQKTDAFRNQLRRRMIYHFDKRRITEGLRLRRGQCNSCGKCCEAVLPCPFVFKKDGKSLCRIHQHKPVMCELYPFEESDFFKHLKDSCGYWFVDEAEERRRLETEQVS